MVDGALVAALRGWADAPPGPTALQAAALGATVQQLGFDPGERTRDRGDLGSRTGVTELGLPDGVTAVAVRPVAAESAPPVDRFELATSGAALRLAAVEGGRYTLTLEG